ncbi:hypothetical protein IU433_18580 [Nocardia puris]|uniref:Protein RecA n=1 Tax=Nocardia puris TaxID=208602 RepID=A0A366DFG9_9NOCA|nr:hypothetical protein [Nocardia puris]MBF6212452.1 hypothetical protein [Nocardia puris]MBF6366699.1 hypothetical protein [Nocardia puris]MBF6461041.1 hypothetical protein [Nocardia puris]RBO88812.1 hypothetical protein DFR74_10837 [Nocardia puris]
MGSDVWPAAEKRRELEELRAAMAAVPARGERAARSPLADDPGRAPLPVPAPLAELLPGGGLGKGSVVVHTGARSLLAGLLASVTERGGHAALVGMPGFGLLAAAEMGAALERLAVVADPGPDPVEVAAVLLDGLDLVVLGLRGAAVPPARTRVLAARARAKGSALVVTEGSWPNPTLRVDARVTGQEGLGRGHGRLRSLGLEIAVRHRAGAARRARVELRPERGRVEWVAPGAAVSSIAREVAS